MVLATFDGKNKSQKTNSPHLGQGWQKADILTLLIRWFKVAVTFCDLYHFIFLSYAVSFWRGGWHAHQALLFCLKEPPEQVILELQPAWVAVDEAFTVKCHVPSVAPLESLTLALLQGNQELHRKNFMSLAVASQRAEVIISVRAQRENDRCNFSCRAELDLSLQGGSLFQGNSPIKILRIFGESELKCRRNPGAHLALAFGTKFSWGLG